MKSKGACLTTGFLVILIVLCVLLACHSAYGAFLYKSYIVRYDRGWDILCEPYVVKKNDWVFKLFRQKGEIAHEDFPAFLRIFKRINPHVRDINRIRPGQQIMIPLKKLPQESLREPSPSIVTIPFVTISNMEKILPTQSTKYKVQSGDCVSVLIARNYGAYGTKSYKEGVKLFMLNNPHIDDLDHIYAGQFIVIPGSKAVDLGWYQTDSPRTSKSKKTPVFSQFIPDDEEATESIVAEVKEEKPKPPLVQIASALDAKFYNKGNYYFPSPGKEDFKLDLAKFPIIELKSGKRLFFFSDDNLPESVFDAVKSHWKDVNVVRTTPNASVEQMLKEVFEQTGKDHLKHRLLFSDNGVNVEVRGQWIIDRLADKGKTVRHICITSIGHSAERTPRSILRYLDQNNIIIKEVITNHNGETNKERRLQHHEPSPEVVTIYPSEHKVFVKSLITAMGFQYTPDVEITFPYADVQVKAISNLITKIDGSTFLIDFGDLYGDALGAIEKTGLDIIQVKMEDNVKTIIKKILNTADVSFSSNPNFLAAHRPAVYNTMLTIPGFLVGTSEKSKVLVSLVPLHSSIVRFLTNEGIKIILVESQEKAA
ncbi:MAG: LysM peptidoglycan-binding domain-containing protein [Desulfobacterales bacterium]|nr:MAG: LysM peptidoglycan-binding domain-containing protein [Desulfobacterales bacterium]